MLALVIVLGYLAVHFAFAYREIVVGEEHPTSWRDYVVSWLRKDEIELPKNEEHRVDILVLGIRGENDVADGGLLTDTILLASIDTQTGKAALVSLPRDLYIDTQGILANGDKLPIKGKINEVYEKGYVRNQGLTLATQVFSDLTGVHIDHAVLFDFQAFSKIVDTLGGVDITLAKPFSEKNQWGYEFSLPAGKNHLNGEQSLYYVRSRFSSSDFDRARRQQEVIFAIKKKATDLGFLANPSKITEMLGALKGNVRTNIQIWEIKDLLDATKNLKSETLKTSVLSTDNLLYETHDPSTGAYILLPKGDDFKIIKEYFKTILQE